MLPEDIHDVALICSHNKGSSCVENENDSFGEQLKSCFTPHLHTPVQLLHEVEKLYMKNNVMER